MKTNHLSPHSFITVQRKRSHIFAHNQEEKEHPLTPHFKEEALHYPHIIKEEEEHGISQEGEHPEWLEEFPVIGVPVKSEDDEVKVRRRERRNLQAAAQLSSSSTSMEETL
ncbi:uncharacterized protein LOC133545407 isoform X7 [Nerophis ophidion]|uniref:uncharacterized protein LOC133545407 isoform X7 n=1 Tax=Nerophis ophidion TaxID=159077 RepID=UPI002AE08729|nr:uncharacterized protein LOC133545407 isoform X7 [Nerophis ophidion]